MILIYREDEDPKEIFDFFDERRVEFIGYGVATDEYEACLDRLDAEMKDRHLRIMDQE